MFEQGNKSALKNWSTLSYIHCMRLGVNDVIVKEIGKGKGEGQNYQSK